MKNNIKSKRARSLITSCCNCPKNTGIPHNENRAYIEVSDVEMIINRAESDAEVRAKNAVKRLLEFNGCRLPETDSGMELFMNLFDSFYNNKI